MRRETEVKAEKTFLENLLKPTYCCGRRRHATTNIAKSITSRKTTQLVTPMTISTLDGTAEGIPLDTLVCVSSVVPKLDKLVCISSVVPK